MHHLFGEPVCPDPVVWKPSVPVQAKLTQQKNLYDAVCMDRNLHAKNVVEATEQIDDMRRKFKIMFHQTTALILCIYIYIYM